MEAKRLWDEWWRNRLIESVNSDSDIDVYDKAGEGNRTGRVSGDVISGGGGLGLDTFVTSSTMGGLEGSVTCVGGTGASSLSVVL